MLPKIIIDAKKVIFNISFVLAFTVSANSINAQNTETAYSAMKSANYSKAIELYSQQIAINQQYAPIFYGRGLAYCRLGNFQSAIEDFTKAIQLDSKHSDSYYARGLAYAKLNEYQKALSDFNNATDLNSKKAEYHYAKANVFYYLEDDINSIDSYNKALNSDPGFALAYYGRGVAYRYSKNNEKAAADFQSYYSMTSADNVLRDEAKRMIDAIEREKSE